MKVLKIVSVLLVMIVSLLSVSCSKDEKATDPEVLGPNGGFKVNFRGHTFNSTTTTAVMTGTKISIVALDSLTGENFAINLTEATVGEYSTADKVSILYKEKNADVFGFLSQNALGSTATVNITSVDNATKRIKGTFKFIGNWNDPTNTTPPADIQFLSGAFDIPFTIEIPIPVESFFKVDFNGQTFSSTTSTAIITDGTIIIGAMRGTNGESFSIALNGATTGVYNSADDVITYTPSDVSEYDYTNFSGLPSTNTGSVTITAINETNHTISGTFSFIGHWSDFTNTNPPAPIGFEVGSFTIPYTSSLPSTTDTFFAKVDGLEFVESFIATAFATVGTEDVISVNANNIADDIISISINDTYTVGNSYSAVTEVKCSLKEGGVVSNASMGTVTIVNKTATRISGTFSFTTVSGRTITEGAFDVAY